MATHKYEIELKKRLLETKTLGNLVSASVTMKNSFILLTPGVNVIKLFTNVNLRSFIKSKVFGKFLHSRLSVCKEA